MQATVAILLCCSVYQTSLMPPLGG